MFRNYILIAFRKLLRNKTISFINIFGLSVSMSVCFLLILIIADQYSYDDFHEKRDKIYRVITERVQQKQYTWETATTAYPLADELANHTSVEEVVKMRRGFSGVARWEDSEIPLEVLYASSNFFSVFDFPLEHGSREKALSIPNSIVLQKDLAEKIFADNDPINQTIEIEDLGSFTVTGVLGEQPGKSHMVINALISAEYLKVLESEGKLDQSLNDWNAIYSNYVYYTLKEGRSLEEINQFLAKADDPHYEKDSEYVMNFKSQSINDITPGPLLSNNLGFGLPSTFVYVMMAIALILLTLACINYANLTTAHSIGRAREMGVRKVVGARRRNIVFQFLIESMIISLVAFVIADVIAEILHFQLNKMLNDLGAPISMSFDTTSNLYLYFLGFTLVTGFMAGIVPSIFFAKTRPLAALKKQVDIGGSTGFFAKSRVSVRKVLVVAQFAFSIFFVITILAIYQQMNLVFSTDHGFRTENTINVKLQGMDFQKISSDFSQLPTIDFIGASSHLPALGTNYTMEVDIEGEEEATNMSYTGVSANYIDALDLELIAGSNFPETMPEDEKMIIINESAVKRLGWESPEIAIGEEMTVEGKQLKIIGVLKDYNFQRLDNKIEPMGLRYKPEMLRSMIVYTSSDNPSELISQMEEIWAKRTNRPFDYTFFEDDLRLSYGHFEVLLKGLGYVTFLIVSIACLGLLGMVIFHIKHKTKEIGIRKVLGAGNKHIILLVSKNFIVLILISYLIGAPLAYFVNNQWLELYPYRIDFGIGALFIGLLIVLLIAVLTVITQIRKAINHEPTESLHME